MKPTARLSFAMAVAIAISIPVFTQSTSRLDSFKKEATAEVEQMKDFSAQMVDQVFSYGELGFQEFETSHYLTDILKKNGFQIKDGISGIPTAWTATRG